MHPCTVMQWLQTGDSGWESWLSSQNRHPIHFQNSKPAVSSASKIIPWFYLSFFFFRKRVFLLERTVTVYIFNELCYWRSAMDRLTAHIWSAGRLLLPRRCQMKSRTLERFLFTWMKRITCGAVGSPTMPTSKSSPLKMRTIYCFSNPERMKFHCMYVYDIWTFFHRIQSTNLFYPLSLSQHRKLNIVSSCMETVMTIGGVDCNAQVLLNELTCRIPKGVVIPPTGLPVRVRGFSFKSPIIQINCNHHE